MKQRSKRITVALLAVLLAAVLGAGLLVAFLPGRGRFAGDTAELTGDDFEYSYASSLAYGADTAETNGSGDVYGWGYDNNNKDDATYAYITGIHNEKLEDLRAQGVSKLVLNIPAEHNGKPLKFVQQDAFAQCTMKIIDINMPLSVYWQIDGSDRFKFDNASSYARADGETATFTAFKPQTGSGITTLILPSNVWIDTDGDERFEDGEPTYRYAEYLFKGEKGAAYTNLVVMPDVVNIFNGEEVLDSNADRPKMQGGLLSKSQNLESVYFCTGRSEVLHLYPLTFENCTSLTEISLSAGVYLEDGARVFQGSSALEKFTIADEKTAAAPLFYTVGADGALYTNNYSYSYMDQNDAQAVYEWWKLGGQGVKGVTYGADLGAWGLAMKSSMGFAYYPRRIFDDWSADKNRFSDEGGDLQGTLEGASTGTKATYYEKGDGDANIGIGIPEGSFVFDAVQNDSTGTNDFATLTEGNITSGILHPAVASKSFSLTQGGKKATITTGNASFSGNTGTYTVNGKTYNYKLQLKNASHRYLKIETDFNFDIRAYFVGSYTGEEADGTAHPRMGLFTAANFKNPGNKYEAKAANASAALSANPGDVIEVDGSESDKITPLIGSDLSSGTYYLGQPSDDTVSSGLAQLLFIVITPSEKQEVADFEFQTQVTNEGDTAVASFETPKLHSVQINPTKWNKLTVKMRALTAAGETVTTEDISWAWQKVDGWSRTDDMLDVSSIPAAPDENGWWTFEFTPDDREYSAPLVLRFTASGHTEYLYFNVFDPDYRLSGDTGDSRSSIPSDGKFLYPDIEAMYTPPDNGQPKNPPHLEFTQERVSKYQILVSMPAKAKSADSAVSEYVNSFEFAYHETVEIGPNAFQNTFITVIKIPDRIAKIGASAFRFSEHLQTVYLPDSTQVGLNAFGQEADADPGNGTVYTAGKKNFFLIAPSRASYEGYLFPLTDDPKAPDDENYNYFPIHAESVSGGFQDLGGKDASYDYTPYLTYEISVNFLKYGEGDAVVSSETRTFLYGMDAHFVKANVTTDWAAYSENYDNNAPVYFGRISGNTVQQVNTIPTDIPWSVAADGWYYDEDAVLPSGDWYFGDTQVVTSASADDFTAFFGGTAGGEVNTVTYENRARTHYAAVVRETYGVNGITETGQTVEDAGSLRDPQTANVTIKTMPFAVTLKNKSEARESRIDFDVPTFQNIGAITYGEDTCNSLPTEYIEPDDTWKVPMLNVTFDYNGFPMSRIFENFKSNAMTVSYEACLDLQYEGKAWEWYPREFGEWSAEIYDEMKFDTGNGDVPYDVGYYRITVKFAGSAGGSGYNYRWSGVYNGERAEEDAEEFTFILHIEPRKVPLSDFYAMQYTGQGFTLLEDNPYLIVEEYEGSAPLGTDGLPYQVGSYNPSLRLYDPKYLEPSTTSSDNPVYTPNLQFEGTSYSRQQLMRVNEGEKNRCVTILIVGDEPFTWEYWNYKANAWRPRTEPDGSPVTFDGPLSVFNPEVRSYTYDGAPVSIEDAFYGIFSSNSIDYTVTHNGKTVTEIKDAGEYTVTITPAEGYVWWKGSAVIESSTDTGNDNVDGWTLDDYWAAKDGGYTAHNRDTLTFTVFVEKKPVRVPSDSYAPYNADSLYSFAAPIGGDYEVVGYHEHSFEEGAEIPKASATGQWASVITKEGVYDVLLRLTDPVNCTWDSTMGESHGDNYYVTVRLYAGYDREKAYPAFNADLGTPEGSHESDGWVTLTRTYDAVSRGLDALFTEGKPTTAEATYQIVKLAAEPESREGFVGEEVTPQTIVDAGYYGVIVTLNDPFLFAGTDETVAYYLVHIEEAVIVKNPGSKFEWERKQLFSADDPGVELKLTPEDPADGDYPLIIVAPGTNSVIVTYHLEKHVEGGHDEDTIDGNIDKLNKGEDVFSGAWFPYTEEQFKVNTPGGYCAYVKVEAPNHKVYYNYISLHIFNEELVITLNSGLDSEVVYGEGKHTQEELRTAMFEAIKSITAKGGDGGDTMSEDRTKTLNQRYFFFYFMKDGEEYDIEETAETYLDVGGYELYVRYNGPLFGSEEETNQYINFTWAGGRPKFTIIPRPITVSLGTIAGHTYFNAPDMSWQAAPVYAYTGDPSKAAIVSRGGVEDDPQISYEFVLGGDTFGSLSAVSAAGEYTVKAECGNANYAVTLDKAYTYTIAPLELTLNSVANVAYDGEEHAPAITFAGLPDEHIVLLEGTDFTLSYAQGGVSLGAGAKPREAGTYTVTVTFASGNYVFEGGGSSAEVTFIIKGSTLDLPYLLTVAFPYTGADLRGAVTAALQNYDAAIMSVAFYASGDGTGALLAEVVNAGNYSIKITLTDPDCQWVGGSTELVLPFTVTRRAHASLTITAADIEATYGQTGSAFRPAVSGLPEGLGLAFIYSYEGIDGTTYASSSDAPVNVGKYRVIVTAVYAGDVNDEPFTVTATATLTIVPRVLTFSLDPAEGAGGLVDAVFTDANGNAVALASADYTFAYSFKGAAVESMTKAGEYTVTVTLTGDAAKNNTLANNTAVYTLTQGLSGGGTGGDDDFDAGVALILMGAQVVLLGTVFGLAVKKKREEKANSEEEN